MKWVYKGLLIYFLMLLVVLSCDYRTGNVILLNSMMWTLGYFINPVMLIVLYGFNHFFLKTK